MHQVDLFGYGTRRHDRYCDQSKDPQRSVKNNCWDYQDHYDDRQHQTSSIPCKYDEHQRTDPHHFFLANAGDLEKDHATMGGGIKSPRNSVNRRSARNLRVSFFDAAALADKDHHGGVDGFDPPTITIIKTCGYSTISFDDVTLCYNEVIHLHCKTLYGWVNTRTLQREPLVKRIVEKALQLFKKLDGIMAAELVYFYDEFQKTVSAYLVPFMPFDAISKKVGFKS
jgi:hypothetical protein